MAKMNSVFIPSIYCTSLFFFALLLYLLIHDVGINTSIREGKYRVNEATGATTSSAWGSGSNSTRKPPQPPPSFSASPASIIQEAKSCIEDTWDLYDRLTQTINETDATFDNVMVPIAQAANECSRKTHVLGFYKSVLGGGAVRNASIEAVKMLAAFETEACLHRGIFRLVFAVARSRTADPLTTAEEQQRLLDNQLRCFQQHGLHLDSAELRLRYREVQTRLTELQYLYEENLTGPAPVLELTKEDLLGVPDGWLGTLQVSSESGLYQLPLAQPDVSLVLQYAAQSKTRERVFIASENRNPENAAIFAEMVNLRNEAARILGFENHADWALQGSMVKSWIEVNSFLDRLAGDLEDGGREEIQALKELQGLYLNEPSDTCYYLWDHHFYRRLQAEQSQTNTNLMSAYFPLEHVLPALIQLVEGLFGIKFEEMKPPSTQEFSSSMPWEEITWHADVQLFAVWDSDDRFTESFLGYLYLDLSPRPGKFGHVANRLLQPGFAFDNGTRWFPATVLLGNFPRPAVDQSSPLQFSDMVTLLHELGHCVHNLVSRTSFSRFHGTRTAQDFLETPSQLLENWCWEPSILESLSYNTTSDSTTPSTLLQKLIDSQKANRILSTLQQIHIATFDMAVHQLGTAEPLDPTAVATIYNRLQREIVGLDSPYAVTGRDDWGHGYANFGHLVQGYDARYYGYLSSQIYSADIFYAYFKDDLFNHAQMRRYRYMVLEKGGSEDEMAALSAFLWRQPSSTAFYRKLGLS